MKKEQKKMAKKKDKIKNADETALRWAVRTHPLAMSAVHGRLARKQRANKLLAESIKEKQRQDILEKHRWKSWRDEYTDGDIDKALLYAGLGDWTHDRWSDGDIQFVANTFDNELGGVSFDDLAKLRTTFTPVSMVVQALVEEEVDGEPKLYVTMSWNELNYND